MKLWKTYDHFTFNRIAEGIISVLLSNRAYPVIKYVKGSEISNQIGRKVLVSNIFYFLLGIL